MSVGSRESIVGSPESILESRSGAPTIDYRLPTTDSRVVIEHIVPEVDAGRFPIKRAVGESVDVTADIFANGHDVILAVLRDRHVQGTDRVDVGADVRVGLGGSLGEHGESAWALERMYGWVLAHPRPFAEAIPCKGSQMLFGVPEERIPLTVVKTELQALA